MAIKTLCPNCRTPFTLADQMNGKKVRCKNCAEPFVVGGADKDDDVPEARLAREDRFQDRARSAAPASRVRDDDPDDDSQDRPRKKSVRKQPSNGLPLGLIIGGAAALVVLLVGGVGAACWFLMARPATSDPQPTAAAGPDQQQLNGAPNPAPGPNGQPDPGRVNPPNGGVGPSGGKSALRYRWEGAPHVYAVHVEADRGDFLEMHDGNCIINVRKNVPRPAAPEERKGTGTGFVVNPNGYLVTCAHVVEDAAKIDVSLGGKTYGGTVVAIDHDHDVAVVQIAGQNLPTLSLGNSDAAEVGMEVRAMGFPLSTVLGANLKATRGTLSGINNEDGRKVFQIDASINPGNSGGPLVTETGEVLGVNSAKLTGEAINNVGFAAPSNDARKLLTDKGVAFATGGWAAKLDGPTLVKRVSPAVALITVTLDPQAGGEGCQLICTGRLAERKVAKGGALILPGPPSFAGFVRTQIDIDAVGHVLNVEGGNQMPHLLGDLGLFLVEALPPDNRRTWETRGGCTITEGGNGPAMPRIPRIPRPPRFGPQPPPSAPPRPPVGQTTFQAKERTVYTLGAVGAETATFKKHYELTAPAKLALTGDGEIVFDFKGGLPRSSEFKANLTVGAAGRAIPLTVTFKRLEGADRDKVLNPPAPPPPPVVDPKPVPIAAQGDRTKIQGFDLDPEFSEKGPEGGLLVGFEVGLGKFINNDIVKAVRPIYRVGDKDSLGKQQGTEIARIVKVLAKPGYAVGAITLKTALGVDGFSLTFMKVANGRLDPKDAYESEWVGGKGGHPPVILSGQGALVIGLLGKANMKDVTGLGLLLQPAAPDADVKK
jgi:predicted Zn finger-like uncharacterized protein